MKKMTALMVNEWKFFCHTPFALFLVPAFLILCGVYFDSNLKNYLDLATPKETYMRFEGLSVTVTILEPFYESFLFLFVMLVPLITMRVFAEEKKMGTYDLLMSYPLKPIETLLGKYFGVLFIALGFLVLSFLYPAIVMMLGDPYQPQIWLTYLGIFLFLMMYVAIGVVVSLYTENQLIAAVFTLLIYFITYIFKFLAYVSPAPLDNVFRNFLIIAHIESFKRGFIYSGDIVVYICVTVFVLLLGYRKIQKRVS